MAAKTKSHKLGDKEQRFQRLEVRPHRVGELVPSGTVRGTFLVLLATLVPQADGPISPASAFIFKWFLPVFRCPNYSLIRTPVIALRPPHFSVTSS